MESYDQCIKLDSRHLKSYFNKGILYKIIIKLKYCQKYIKILGISRSL